MDTLTNGKHIIIGAGGTGGKVIKAMRKRIFQKYSAEERKKIGIGFLYVDSSKEMMRPNDPSWKVLGQNAQIGRNDFVFIREASLSEVFSHSSGRPGISSWLGSRKIWENIVGTVGSDGAAAQKRRLGRFLFASQVSDFNQALVNKVQELTGKGEQDEITFHVVAGLAGGTGSGSVVDIISQIRAQYNKDTSTFAYKIIVYCMLPEANPLPGFDKGNYHANGYAALLELNALKTGRFLPYDVNGTGNKYKKRDDVFYSCFLYTNTNENGIGVNPVEDLPVIVSDFIYHYMFVHYSSDSSLRGFFDAYTAENVDPPHEADENARDKESAVPVRSKKFNAFGIKRIVNPEEEVKEYFTYSFIQQAIYQMKYNNWSDDFGYQDEIKNEDYYSIVNDAGFLKRLFLSDDHLTLSEGILPSEIEQKWKKIPDDWASIMPLLSSSAWSSNESHALTELSKLCQERHDKNFRKTGVSKFYEVKKKAREEHASEISKKMEEYLFSEWHSGAKSLYEISKLVETLVEHIDNRLSTFDSKIVNKEKKLEELLRKKVLNEQEWSGTGILSSLLGKKKNLYQAYTTLLQAIFTLRTELEAMAFAKELLKTVKIKMNKLSTDISNLTGQFNIMAEEASKNIATRCQDRKGDIQEFRDTVIRYYDAEGVRGFNKEMTTSSSVQKKQTSRVRNKIVELSQSDSTFSGLLRNLSQDVLLSTLETECFKSAVDAHDELVKEKKIKLIGKNIIDQLYEQYGSIDQADALNDFARNIMNASGTFLSFNPAEVELHIDNNDPPKPGVNDLCRAVLVSLPKAEGKERFIDDLKDALINNKDPRVMLYFDEETVNTNEITVLNLAYSFSLRMVRNVRILREKYQSALEGGNEDIQRLVLHLEGDGRQYPPLYVTPLSNEVMIPTLLVAKAMKIIDYQEYDTATGEKAYCMKRVDKQGLPIPPLKLSNTPRFTDIVDDLQKDAYLEIREAVDAHLNSTYLHANKKKELALLVRDGITQAIMPECNNNPNSPVYKKFYDAAVKVMEELNK